MSKKAKSGAGKRFVVLLIVYLMFMGVILVGLSKAFPKGFTELWVQLLIAGSTVVIFLILFLVVEYLNQRKG